MGIVIASSFTRSIIITIPHSYRPSSRLTPSRFPRLVITHSSRQYRLVSHLVLRHPPPPSLHSCRYQLPHYFAPTYRCHPATNPNPPPVNANRNELNKTAHSRPPRSLSPPSQSEYGNRTPPPQHRMTTSHRHERKENAIRTVRPARSAIRHESDKKNKTGRDDRRAEERSETRDETPR